MVRHSRPQYLVFAGVAFLALTASTGVLALSGCERKPATGTSSSSGNSTSSAQAVDWSKVQARSTGEAIMTEKTIARHLDAWHKGAKSRLTLRHDGRNTVTDDAGNTMSVTPQDWKAVIQQVRDSKQPASAAASKSAMYSGNGPSPRDSFGVVPRYMYIIEVIDDATIAYRNDRKVDDGN